MAQMGSFVPARSARIGIVDRLFSRVGAADDLARGRSTFMVEMVETAGILNQASPRSLVILDEIGRGTATFDGLSIAWAVVEYLHEVSQCRALFATHYHELTALAGRLSQVASVTMEVREWKDAIVFLHKVKAGAADRSYGIQVAKLAGLPAAVTKRAAEVLALLEKGDGKAPDGAALLEELPLFAAARPKPPVGFADGANTLTTPPLGVTHRGGPCRHQPRRTLAQGCAGGPISIEGARRKVATMSEETRLGRVDAMTEAGIAAALADPDGQPLTPEDFKRMKQCPGDHHPPRFPPEPGGFAAQFHIPIDTIRTGSRASASPVTSLWHICGSSPASQRRCARLCFISRPADIRASAARPGTCQCAGLAPYVRAARA
jgi:hypothetical protein